MTPAESLLYELSRVYHGLLADVDAAERELPPGLSEAEYADRVAAINECREMLRRTYEKDKARIIGDYSRVYR